MEADSTGLQLAPPGLFGRAVEGLEWLVVQGLLHRYYRLKRAVFPQSYLDELRQAILASPYLNENPLNRNFTGSYGFSVVFKPAGVEQVRRTFPVFTPYLDEVLHPGCNAYYLNPLLLRQSGRIAPHVDLSLRSYTQPDDPPTPAWVSILYVAIPAGMHGGELLLYRGPRPVGRIRPRADSVLHFRGDLRHEVSAVTMDDPDPNAIRLSLVCEQYRLADELLARVPDYTIQSRSGFAAFLEAELAHLDDPD